MRPSSVLIVGFGAVGQSLLPLLISQFGIAPSAITVLDPNPAGMWVAKKLGVHFVETALTPDNYAARLSSHLKEEGLLINVSVDVSSVALILWCRARNVAYLDTCIEPWSGGYGRPGCANGLTNDALRNEALRLGRDGPTAVVAHGANPGLVSHFVRAALRELAEENSIRHWSSWAELASRLDIRVIQIAERDSQFGPTPAGVFCNTWSVDGFLAEAGQRAELGWGTHESEQDWPHGTGDGSGIVLQSPGANVKVKSWVPNIGPQEAYLITHHEALSIASDLTLPSAVTSSPQYRPTVYYAYQPCQAACQALEAWRQSNFSMPLGKHVLREDLLGGIDQLGVLLIRPGGAYWYGSTLTLEEARTISPSASATTMQVVAGMLGALDWIKHHPYEGVVEAEQMDSEHVLRVARPLLGQLGGVHTGWQPRPGGLLLFSDFLINSPIEAGTAMLETM